MKLTEEILDQLIMEELRLLNESFDPTTVSMADIETAVASDPKAVKQAKFLKGLEDSKGQVKYPELSSKDALRLVKAAAPKTDLSPEPEKVDSTPKTDLSPEPEKVDSTPSTDSASKKISTPMSHALFSGGTEFAGRFYYDVWLALASTSNVNKFANFIGEWTEYNQFRDLISFYKILKGQLESNKVRKKMSDLGTLDDFTKAAQKLEKLVLIINDKMKPIPSQGGVLDKKGKQALQKIVKAIKADTDSFNDAVDVSAFNRTPNETYVKNVAKSRGGRIGLHRVLWQKFPEAKPNPDKKFGGFDLKSLKTGGGFQAGDLFKKDTYDDKFGDFNKVEQEHMINKVMSLLQANLNDVKQSDLFKLGGQINEKIYSQDQDKILNINDIFKLFQGDIDKNFDKVNDTNKKKIKSGLATTFRQLVKTPALDDGSFLPKPSEIGRIKLAKKAMMDAVKTFYRAFEYYESNRTVRTKMGAVSGEKLSTAVSSGQGRINNSLKSVFENMTTKGAGIKEKFIEFAGFLNEVNSTNDITGDLQQKFSKFVGIELLYDVLFGAAESTQMGVIFEAFLAGLVTGEQEGADFGGADFSYKSGGKTIHGSAKLLNTRKIEQAGSNINIKDDGKFRLFQYVLAVKKTTTRGGVETSVPVSGSRIDAVDIYLINIQSDGSRFWAWPYNEKLNKKTSPNQGITKTMSFSEEQLSEIIDRCYITTFDMSLFYEKEFQDVSTEILNRINNQVEKAYSAMTDLRSNIGLWVSDKDPVAAGQVPYDYNELGDAITSMEKETDLKIAENKNNLDNILDKLIKEVILNR